jgi:hypothetical protein
MPRPIKIAASDVSSTPPGVFNSIYPRTKKMMKSGRTSRH